MKIRKISDEDLPLYLKLLPVFAEYAEQVVDESLEEFIEVLVYSEIRDNNDADEFISSIQVKKLGGEKRIIEFKPASSRIRALESGVKPFSIKDKMLSSPKAKLSKEGYLYRTVPITKDVAVKASTQKDADIRSRIQEAIRGSRFSLQFAKSDKDTGQFIVQDRGRGVIRKRTFGSEAEYRTRKKPLAREYVIFRTMSSKPGTSSWFHPGTSGKNIVGQIESWLRDNERAVFDEVLEKLISSSFGR